MSFLILENVRSGVNELAVRCSTSIKAFRFAGNGAFCRRAHGKQFCDKANGVIMYAKEVVEQIGEGLEEDGSVPFFDADMLPDGLAELYKLCTLLRHMCSAPDDEGRLQFSHRSFSDRLLQRDSAVCRVLDNYYYPGEEESSRTYLRKH